MSGALGEAVEAFACDLAAKARGYASDYFSVCEVQGWDAELDHVEQAMFAASERDVLAVLVGAHPRALPPILGRGASLNRSKAFALALFLAVARRARAHGNPALWRFVDGAPPLFADAAARHALFTSGPWPRPPLADALDAALYEQRLRYIRSGLASEHYYVRTAALQVGVCADVAVRQLAAVVTGAPTRKVLDDLAGDPRIVALRSALSRKEALNADRSTLRELVRAVPWFVGEVSLDLVAEQAENGRDAAGCARSAIALDAVLRLRSTFDEFPLRVTLGVSSPTDGGADRLRVRWNGDDVAKLRAHHGRWVVTSGSLVVDLRDAPFDHSAYVSLHDVDNNESLVCERTIGFEPDPDGAPRMIAEDPVSGLELRLTDDPERVPFEGVVRRWKGAQLTWYLCAASAPALPPSPGRPAFSLERSPASQAMPGPIDMVLLDRRDPRNPLVSAELAGNPMRIEARPGGRWSIAGRIECAPLSTRATLTVKDTGKVHRVSLGDVRWFGVAKPCEQGWTVLPDGWRSLRALAAGRVRVWPGEPVAPTTLLGFGRHERIPVVRRVAGAFEVRVDALARSFGRPLVVHAGNDRRLVPLDGLDATAAPLSAALGAWYTLLPGRALLERGALEGIRVLVDARGFARGYDLSHDASHHEYFPSALFALARAAALPLAGSRWAERVRKALAAVVAEGEWPGAPPTLGLQGDVPDATWCAVLRELLDGPDEFATCPLEADVLRAAREGGGVPSLDAVRAWFSVDPFVGASLFARLFRGAEDPELLVYHLQADAFFAPCLSGEASREEEGRVRLVARGGTPALAHRRHLRARISAGNDRIAQGIAAAAIALELNSAP